MRKPPAAYFKLLYVDTAMFGSAHGVECVVDFSRNERRGCTGQQMESMSVAENKALALAFVEGVMNGQHVERIDEFVAADAVHHEPDRTENYRDALHGVFDDARYDWRFVVDDVIAEGDTVVVRCTASYTNLSDSGPYGIPYRPGARASVQHAHFFRFADGKIVEHWPVREIWEAVRQFHNPESTPDSSTEPPAGG